MKRIFSLLLALLLLVTLPLLAACNGEDDTNGNAYDPDLAVRVWTLNGTTGFGMAPLIQNDKDGKAALNYEFTVDTNPVNVRDALISGTADIGAVPTNVASALFNATKGGVVLLAINTRGVLYLVTNTGKAAEPTSLADLSGKTVYCPAQNPAFITKALLDKAGITDVTLDSTTYAAPEDLQKQVAAGNIEYAILPEPMVTVAKAAAAQANVTLSSSLDITAEWNKHFPEGSLVQGCVVARKEFVENHPNEVAKFLEEYKTSLEYVVANPKEASVMIASAGILAKAAVAQSAIPKCNLAFITGAAMKSAMSEFLSAMPVASIGGALPTDGFYYGV